VIGWWLVECPVDVFDETGERIGAIESDGWLIDDVDTDVVVGPEGWLEPVRRLVGGVPRSAGSAS
jgi:hypothetical protein